MKKVISTIALTVLVLVNFIKAQTASPYFTTEYIPLTVPQLYHNNISYLDSKSGMVAEKKVDDVIHNPTLLPSFSSLISSVTIFQSDKSGNLTLAGQSISASGSNYVVIYDFTQTQQLTFKEGENTTSVLVGIAVRMTAKLYTKKAGINLSNLFGIGLAAAQNKLVGSLEVKAFGMSSQKINEIIPVPTDLSTGTIQNALTSVATIKSHIYDDDTKITPLILAYNVSGDDKTKKNSLDFNTLLKEKMQSQ